MGGITDLHVLVALVADVLDLQLGARVADDAGVLGQQLVPVQPPDGRVDLLLGQVSLQRKRTRSDRCGLNGTVLQTD